MIKDDQELAVTQQRVQKLERLVAAIRHTERNPVNYRLSAGGFLAEIDRMNLEIRDYLWSHPVAAEAVAA